ncbi:cell cycle regulator of non-homologous end joining [Anser cygnoides]|uniref:cell cycle regulator of non-homologous end joining n=1 Tax=Anser cygnoides TaxID=8845 RepID=UPI0034D2F261
MNEAELVDVALGVLAESLGRERAEEKARSGSEEEEQEQQPAPSSSPESAAGVGTGGDRSPGLPSPPGAGAEGTVGEDSEEDVLKYVREIFFT